MQVEILEGEFQRKRKKVKETTTTSQTRKDRGIRKHSADDILQTTHIKIGSVHFIEVLFAVSSISSWYPLIWTLVETFVLFCGIFSFRLAS